MILILFLSHFYVLAQNAQDKKINVSKIFPFDSTYVLEAIHLSREIHRSYHNETEEYLYAQKAIEGALELKDTLLYARTLDNLGLLNRYHQQYLQSFPLHKKAFDLIENFEAPSIYKMIFANNTGVAARYGGKYDLSVSYYLKALKIAEKENDLKNIAISSNGLGNALGNISRRQKESLEYFNQALKAEKTRNNTRGIAMNLLSVSDHYITKREFPQARKQLGELMAFNQDMRDEHGMAITDEYFGLSYLHEGKNYAKAAEYFQRSFNRFEKLKNKMKQAELLSLLGEVNNQSQQKEKALNYYKKSQKLTDSNANKGLIVANAMSISKIYESQNQPAEALKYYKIAQRFTDSINLHQQEIEIAALTNTYELEKKETQIEQLELETERRNEQILLRDEKIKNHQTILWLIIFSIISILGVFLMQFRNIRVKRKTRTLLDKQQKEKLQAIYERNLAQAEMLASRMKINPHFLFNCLNAINSLIQKEENHKASKYLIVFSRFVRMVLETSKSPVVSLKEELGLIQHYLTLEANRFDSTFSYHFSHDAKMDLENIFIPPLLLQPYVENAIWHGLIPSNKDTKELAIKVHKEDTHIEMIIEDNGVGRTKNNKYKSTNNHKSMGMEITQDRIDLFNKSYKSQISCSIEDKTDKNGKPDGTLVKLRLSHSMKFIPVPQV